MLLNESENPVLPPKDIDCPTRNVCSLFGVTVTGTAVPACPMSVPILLLTGNLIGAVAWAGSNCVRRLLLFDGQIGRLSALLFSPGGLVAVTGLAVGDQLAPSIARNR